MKTKPDDGLDPIDALNLNLNMAKGIIYSVAQALMKEDRELNYALEAAIAHLDAAKQAAGDLARECVTYHEPPQAN